MPSQLFEYQEHGARWLASKNTALLADAPRLGKAVQSIRALDLLNAFRALIVCRGIARANWCDEFGVWSRRGWRCHPVYGSSFKFPALVKEYPQAIITSYESLPRVLSVLPSDFSFDSAIIDESHYCKTLDAKRTQLCYGKNGVPKFSKKVWSLTGTPTPNGLASELWVFLFTSGLTKLSFWDFANKFCIVQETGYGKTVVRTKLEMVPELRALMAPKVLRRTAEDVSVQLPKMSFSTVMVQPGAVDLREHRYWIKWAVPHDRTAELNQILESELGIFNGIMPDGKFTNETLELLKANAKSISTLRKYTGLQKVAPAYEIISAELEANAYPKVVIFAYHVDIIKALQLRLQRFGVVTMYGGSNPKTVALNIKKFQNPKSKVRVFIGQISAAGTSISLNAANHIFFLEESFVPMDNVQAAERCGGVNQPKPIFVRTFCLENSYDYRLQNLLRNKMVEAAAILDNPRVEKYPDLPEDMV